ncbi:MAG: hypothetical protein R3A48_16735 [Polyangiales bacterium]
MRRAIALAYLAAGCGAEPPAEAGTTGAFVALTRDFEPFRTWRRTAVGSGHLAGHGDGPRFVYANRAPPAGAAYPVGTVLVKTVEPSSDARTWELFAMVKRGGGFNARGAEGWEFFRLAFNDGGDLVMLARGAEPGDGDDYSGGGGDAGAGCNGCHAGARGSDSILAEALRPGAP